MYVCVYIYIYIYIRVYMTYPMYWVFIYGCNMTLHPRRGGDRHDEDPPTPTRAPDNQFGQM